MEFEIYGFNIVLITFHMIIAMVIALSIGKLHELLHMWKAKQLGYTIKSFKLWKNEIDINIDPSDPNVKKITRAPYYFLMPLGIVIIVIGLYIEFLGLIIGGVATVFIHCLSYWMEGRASETVSEV